MAARIAGFIVTLESDLQEDYADEVIAAIGMIKGVSSVEAIKSDPYLHIAQQRAEFEIRERVWNAVERPVNGR